MNVPTIANDRHQCNYVHYIQPDVIVTINKEDGLNARTDVGRPKKQTEESFDRSEELPDMCAEHGFGKSSESTTVKRKRSRPQKQTEASLGRSEELPDMCAEHGLGKSSDVERKRTRLGKVLTLQQLLTKGVGWFTIKPSASITVSRTEDIGVKARLSRLLVYG